MISKRTVLIFILIVCALWVLDIRGSRSFVSDKVKITFLNLKDALVSAYQRHFDQANTIARYQQELESYRRLQFSYADLNARNQALALEVHDLANLQASLPNPPKTPNASTPFATYSPPTCASDSELTPPTLYTPPIYTLTRVYGFAQLNNTYELLLDVQTPYPKDKILGMVAFDRAIGIAVQKEGRFIGLLHGDARTTYSVMIQSGGKIYYGFITNQNFKTYVDYLPAYAPVKQGDVVLTSGLDGIFSAGIFVGTIASVENHYAYKKALLNIKHLTGMIFYTTLVTMP
ncbi:rod shape-determining protein MreC [Helicobacter vulpis]|uniref:rod shape-determining protein MreC n=1 Tax=Helicobacter vulpis TaxID=2316076 RepID=UPI000EAFBC59|nr:rod shape-determining protein MreC [Helicobacter vulpis]